MQHCAGFILFRDVRDYAIRAMDAGLSEDARAAAVKAIDDALYGMMMVADGVTGSLRNNAHSVRVHVSVQLLEGRKVVQSLDLADGDGACMGFHGWKDGDFGEDAVEDATSPAGP